MITKFYEAMEGGGEIDYRRECHDLNIKSHKLKEENQRLREALKNVEKVCLKDFEGLEALQKYWKTVFRITSEALSQQQIKTGETK